MARIILKADINRCEIEGWQTNTGEVNARVMNVEMCEELCNCANQFVTFELADGTVYESLVVDGKARIPTFEKSQFVEIGLYAADIEGDECIKRYSPKPTHASINNGGYKGDADTEPKPTPGDYAELLDEIEEIKNNTGGGSGVDLDILTEVDPTKEHTNEQVYGAKALDETFVDIEEIINEVGKPITTEKIVDDAITIDKVEPDFFNKGLQFADVFSNSGDVYFMTLQEWDKKPLIVESYLRNKAEEITQDNGDGIPTVQAVCDYVEEQLKNVGGSSSKAFEQIATVTVKADTDGKLPNSIVINKDNNGDAFELTDIYCEMLVGLTDGTSGKITIAADAFTLMGNWNIGLTNTPRKWWFKYDSYGDKLGGLVSAPNTSIAPSSVFPNVNVSSIAGQPIPIGINTIIKKLTIAIYAGTEKTFVEGTTITLWGVRK